MAQLVDTSVLIALERRELTLGALPRLMPGEPNGIASITASELLVGVHRTANGARRQRREAYIEAILGAMLVISFDLPVARVHARLWAELASTGAMVGAHDLIIAATAIAHGYAVLTENVRDFERVPGLVVRRTTW